MSGIPRFVRVLSVVLAAVFLASSAFLFWSSGILNQPPCAADARVVRHEVTERSDSEGHVSRYYRRVYAFVDSEGVSHEVTSVMGSSSLSDDVGDGVLLRYWPDDPESGWVVEGESSPMLTMSGVFLLLGSAILAATFVLIPRVFRHEG